MAQHMLLTTTVLTGTRSGAEVAELLLVASTFDKRAYLKKVLREASNGAPASYRRRSVQRSLQQLHTLQHPFAEFRPRHSYRITLLYSRTLGCPLAQTSDSRTLAWHNPAGYGRYENAGGRRPS